MPSVTPVFSLPYPVPADPDNVPSDVNALATATEAALLSLGTWAAFATTWSAPTPPALGNGTLTARRLVLNKRVQFYITLTAGTTTTFGTGVWTFTLPAPLPAFGTVASVLAVDTSAAVYYPGSAHIATTAPAMPQVIFGQGTAGATSAVPFTWATGDVLWISGVYETV